MPVHQLAPPGKKFDMLALGEVLLRLSPEGNERLTQGTRFEKQLGGAELNVAVGAANLGLTTGVISSQIIRVNTVSSNLPFRIISNGVRRNLGNNTCSKPQIGCANSYI